MLCKYGWQIPIIQFVIVGLFHVKLLFGIDASIDYKNMQ